MEFTFHPSFPDKWQLNCPIRLQKDEPDNPNDVELSVQAAQKLSMRKETVDDIELLRKESALHEGNIILAGQVISGRKFGACWIKLSKKGYLPLANDSNNKDDHVAKPFWPTYRVVANTNSGARGVAPYMYTSAELIADAELEAPSDLGDYDPMSRRREESLSKCVGHVFDNPEEPVSGMDPKSSQWWTYDGQLWWPKSVQWSFLGITLPKRVGCIKVPPKPVMERAVNMPPTFIKVGFQGRGYVITLLILSEYFMILVGAIAGVELGWSLRLQLIYALFLVVLSFFENIYIATLVPNGCLWLRINFFKLPITTLKSVLWRWDIYGDVGFAILAYQQRNRFASPLWVGSFLVCVIVVGGRLLYSFYYIRILLRSVDERTLALVSIPSFMTVFQLLCETVNSVEAEARKQSAKRELWCECLRLVCEDLPEIGIQAAYLFGGNAPPACTACAYGFVAVSFLVSIATATPGIFRIFKAYLKYKNVAAGIPIGKEYGNYRMDTIRSSTR